MLLQKECVVFQQLGLQRYHGVGILGFNSAEWFIADIGAILAGWVSSSSPNVWAHHRESHELTVTPLSVSYSFHQSVYVWMCRMLVHHTWVMQSKTWNASTREHNSNSARSLFSFTTSWSIDNITTLNSNLMSCSKVHLFKYFGMTKMSFWITSQSFRWIL